MFITSLHCFYNLVEEVSDISIGEDYWKHMQNKVSQLERMWKDQKAKDEMRETK